jgi:hypothetical protein
MARTITLRLSDEAYESVKRHAEADRQSVSTWIESLLDLEDTRRRCAAHDRWLSAHPDAGVPVLVISSTVYNEIPSEPDTGFGVDLGEGWAAPGLIASLRKTRLEQLLRCVTSSGSRT